MAKQSACWKDVERKAADLFGGVRVTRGSDFGLDRPDCVYEKTWSVEAKSRTALTIWNWMVKLRADTLKFYPGEDRIKVIVAKCKGKRGELIVISVEDFLKVLDKKYLKEIEDMKNRLKEKENES